MNKNKVLIIIGVLLVMGVGVSFAYFLTGVAINGDGANVSIGTNNTLKVKYDAGSSKLVANDLLPGYKTSKQFKVIVTPTNNQNEVTYRMYMDISENTFVKCTEDNYDEITNNCELNAQELVYTLKDSDGNIIKTGDLTGKTGQVEIARITKTTNTEQEYEYTIEIEFVETNKDQNHNSNATIEGEIKVEFAEPTKIVLAVETLIATGELINENGYRYEGKEVNNYVEFNNELWRIIGVFNTEKSDGASGNLVKIIRSESIDFLAWNINKVNNWSIASLKMLLNEGDYYNRTGSYSSNGLTENSKEMIENVVWNLGGASDPFITTEEIYTAERGTTVYENNPTMWIGKVGLMYPSDYGYAAPSNTCARTTELWYYDTTGCYDNNWIFSGYNQWTITPYSGGNYVFRIIYNPGSVTGSGPEMNIIGIRPALYLKSSVQIVDGDGSQSNPYKLSM